MLIIYKIHSIHTHTHTIHGSASLDYIPKKKRKLIVGTARKYIGYSHISFGKVLESGYYGHSRNQKNTGNNRK